LSEAENRLLRAAPEGDTAMCGPNFFDKDPANDPAKAEGWGRRREIRADLIRWLCADQDASKKVDTRGVRAYGAKIVGKLDLSFATVPFPLRLARCRLMEDCNLERIKIPVLYLDGSLTRSVDANGADVNGHIFLDHGFSANGEVDLSGARIGGFLACESGTFKNPSGVALNVDSAQVKGSVFLRDGFSAEGEVKLIGVEIGEGLDCSGGRFKNPNRTALTMVSAEVKGHAFLKDGFSAEGVVNLEHAHIGRNLHCGNGNFKNSNGIALNADGVQVRGSVFLSDSFSAEGEVNLIGAEIGESLDCNHGRFDALRLPTVTVKQTFVWHDVQSVTELILKDARVRVMWDDEASWPNNGKLYLDGFVYDSIAGGPKDASTRLRWLGRLGEFTPQPYRQLAKVLRELGDDEGTKQVLYELEGRARAEERRRLIHAPARWLRSAEDTLSKAAVGYGIYPGRAIWGLCGLTVLGWIVHRRAQQVGAMAPTEKNAYEEYRADGYAPAHYPPFSPLIYSLENCLPLVKFGQDDHWQPDPTPRPRENVPSLAAGWRARFKSLLLVGLPDRVTSPVALRWFRWIMIALGWLLATFFVAAVSGVIKTG